MDRLFVDTNIIIDLLAKRQEYAAAAEIFSLADRGALTLLVSSLSFFHLQYILRKLLKEKSLPALKDLGILVNVASVGKQEIKLALHDRGFADFEDAIQYHTAIESRADFIITRNLKDFRNSHLPVMTAAQYLSSRNS